MSTQRNMFRSPHGNKDKGRDSVVGIATRYWIDGPGIETSLPTPVQASLLYNGYRVILGGSIRGVTAHPHLTPRLKKEYRYTSTLPLGLRGVF